MGLLFIFGTCKQNLQIRIGIGLLLQCISKTVVVCSYDLTLLSGLGRGRDNLVSASINLQKAVLPLLTLN